MRALISLLFLILVPVTISMAQQKYDLKQSLLTARQNNLILKSQKLNIGLAKSDVVTAGLRPNPILNNQTLQLGSSRYFPIALPSTLNITRPPPKMKNISPVVPNGAIK